MAKTLNDNAVATHVADIVHHGEKLILPEGMEVVDAIDLLKRREKYLSEAVNMVETFDVFPYDGALAVDAVLTAKFGWSPATAKPGVFGSRPPTLINVKTGPDSVQRVSWGMFTLPNIEGTLECDVSMKDGRFNFELTASVLRKDEGTIQAIFTDVRKYLKKNSIYRGKAIKIKFCDDNGNVLRMPEPEFIDTSRIKPDQLIYSKDVQAAIDTNLFTPILRVHDCLANGIPVKRGVMLGGTYGTGKTLAATVAARHAVDSGVTYLYIPHANELAQAIEFAKQYQSPACVIFCEDVDRVMSGERNEEIDEILNLIDGIDTKSANIIVVVTTNELESVEPAMLRPGRLDAVIEVTPPDAEAVQKLIRFYGAGVVTEDTDLSVVGELLAGQIPAIVAEVVNRAKLSQLRLQAPGTKLGLLSEEALVEASTTMRAQTKLLNDRINHQPTEGLSIEDVLSEVVRAAVEPMSDKVDSLNAQLVNIKKRVGA